MRFLIDEDFNNDILRGVLLLHPEIDVVRAQDVGLDGLDDSVVLAWAAEEGRIVLSHDVSTMQAQAYARLDQGLRMPGLFFVNQSLPVGQAIEAIVLLIECSLEGEWEDQVRYLPL
jgi:hypothetical protein